MAKDAGQKDDDDGKKEGTSSGHKHHTHSIQPRRWVGNQLNVLPPPWLATIISYARVINKLIFEMVLIMMIIICLYSFYCSFYNSCA